MSRVELNILLFISCCLPSLVSQFDTKLYPNIKKGHEQHARKKKKTKKKTTNDDAFFVGIEILLGSDCSIYWRR